MTKESTQRAAELAALIARHSTLPPHQIAAHVTHLQRIARQLKTIAERACNGYLPPGASRYLTDEQRSSKLQLRAADIAETLAPAIKAWVGGDPRGPCLRLLIEGERGDGFGDGFAVY